MLRLLIVDDEEIIRNAISNMMDFTTIGYELIGTAKNGMEAYDMICDEYPDVIITDINMPVLNGLELIERAHKTDEAIDFVILSGFGEFEYAKKAMQFGVKYYLLKPTEPEQLIASLVQIREEREERHKVHQHQQRQMLNTLQLPMEEAFVTESLQNQEFSKTFLKYKKFLDFPTDCLHVCICSYVEEAYIQIFSKDVHRLLRQQKVPLYFPILYVKNSALLIFPNQSFLQQEQITQKIKELHYEGQSVEFETEVLHYDEVVTLWETIFKKLSRYPKITMIDKEEQLHEIANNLSAQGEIKKIKDAIAEGTDEEIDDIIHSVFKQDSMDMETACNIVLGIYMHQNAIGDVTSLENACEFFKQLYSCTDLVTISSLLRIIALQRTKVLNNQDQKSNILLLKNYVNQHLDDSSLSLKWLAENYLFVNVQYLSKKFVKEEGERFSDYLNRQRMEKAKQLLTLYNNDNIKDIVRLVGFENNPRYFSQVFKRYTGLTPSDYLNKAQ